MYFKALFKKNKSSCVSSGWPIFDLIGATFFLFIWFPISLMDGAIKGRAANELLMVDNPLLYWFVLVIIFSVGIVGFYAFFRSYKNALKILKVGEIE